MGDARTGRPFCRRYALCSCKSISTEVSARNNTAAQKNSVSPKTALTLLLNPRAAPKSQAYTAIGALIDGCGSYPASSKSSNLKPSIFLTAGLRDHHCEQRFFFNVEWPTEKQIAAALVQLAT